MKHVLSLCIVLLAFTGSSAQHTIKLLIKNRGEKQPLAGATAIIEAMDRSAIADTFGIATFENLPIGTFKVRVSYIGLKEYEFSITVHDAPRPLFEVLMEEMAENEQEVIVTSTRSNRVISDIPTRVETISGEELAEKGNMKPGDIRMLLNESTGIQTQQTSATSYSSSIRIQGLDGRYTQVLRDGFPLYAGFAGGLSLMQVAPLDLKQIEVIKGSSSTLYGGGAIGGLVNLVSKTPTEERELGFLGNVTSAGGLDLSSFYSKRFDKVGVTVFVSGNTASPYDPANIGLTAIPKFKRLTLNPRLFFYGGKTTANIGFSYISEDRVGGSINYILKGEPGFFEKNNTRRITTQAQLTHKISNTSQLQFKNSYSNFQRTIQIPAYTFSGLQQSTFTEGTYSSNQEKADWVIGANILTDNFREDRQSNNALRSYHYRTLGAFIQNTWSPRPFFTLETGLRLDHVPQLGVELLPRLSAMLKPNSKLTARLGGGLGYKTPTIFNEEAEKIQFQNILPIDKNNVVNERSAGASFDINYRTRIGETGLSFNQLFFYTKLNRPLQIAPAGSGVYEFKNANGHIDTRGMETNVRLAYADLKLFIGYTYADVNTRFDNYKSWYTLTARHRVNNVLMYEKEGKLKIGAEAYFFSPQKLTDGTLGKSYWIYGLMGEKSWKHFSIFINFENLTDTRQTKFDSIYKGSIDNPTFKDIYAPVDGFVVNGGIKLRT